jgi:hypothetical protein
MQRISADVLRLWLSFGIIVIGIIAVIILVLNFGSNPPTTVGTGIIAISTLVGFLAGQTTGAAGKEKAEDRAIAIDQQKNDVQDKLNKALGALPPEVAKTIV